MTFQPHRRAFLGGAAASALATAASGAPLPRKRRPEARV